MGSEVHVHVDVGVGTVNTVQVGQVGKSVMVVVVDACLFPDRR